MSIKSSEQDLENTIGILLRVGVIAAAVVVLAGGSWLLFEAGSQRIIFSPFRGEPSQLTSISGIMSGLLSGNSRALIQTGLLLLIATPIARVVLALTGFALQRDRLYVAVTLIVLAALLFSLSGG